MSLIHVTIPAGQTFQQWGSVAGFTVLSPSVGATFRVEGHGSYALNTESYDFEADDDGNYPVVGFTPGTVAPLEIVLNLATEGQGLIRVSSGTNFNQEGDTPPAAASTNAPGVTGAPNLFRAANGKLIIGSASNAGNLQADVPNGVTVNNQITLPTNPALNTVGSNVTTKVTSVATSAISILPPTGTGRLLGFYVTNTGTTGIVTIAATGADVVAGKGIAIPPATCIGPIAWDFTNSPGTLFAADTLAGPTNVTTLAIWGT